MARSGVQYEDVHRAIHQLLQQGEAPAVQKIREVLGTGSFTTISEHLRQWKLERAENRDQAPIQALPDTLQRLTHELWQEAQETAQQGLQHYREEADRRVAESQQEASNMRRQAEDALQRERALAEHLGGVQRTLEEKSAALAREEARLESTTRTLQEVQEENRRLKSLAERLEKQNAEKQTKHRQALEALGNKYDARILQEEQRHEAAEARLMTLLDGARQERQEAEKQHARHQTQWEKRLEALEAMLEEQRSAYQKEQAQQQKALWSLQEQKRQLEDEHRRLETRHLQKDTELARLNEELKSAQARLARIPLPPFVY